MLPLKHYLNRKRILWAYWPSFEETRNCVCVFENGPFKTNIYGTFASHRSRKHTPHTIDDFKPELLKRYVNPLNAGDDPVDEGDTEGAVSEDVENLPNLIEEHLAHLLLKLESIFNVPQRCIDELIEELHLFNLLRYSGMSKWNEATYKKVMLDFCWTLLTWLYKGPEMQFNINCKIFVF